ncbi:adenylate/guanylate cyclase domain-containing protein [Rhizobium sp. TH2]|uniref:adenylate/guanylate cyclase domain-containing protein n=1 Tax=Rhizobium sp. TH2 TaxID=2775403 RepID=UPI00215806F7|nr:adenylate/guanylate cyclase domain-containing protein [Rhizobium sp. TH2]UVC06647.1 adenylate/guanylate cyclase domain-containing protein [Rhizobium sp. TH2]
MVTLVAVVAGTLIALGFYRARAVALENVQQQMVAFSDRLTYRLAAISNDTSTLVGMIGSVPNSFLSPPRERLDNKVAALREALLRSRHIDGIYVGYPDGSFFHTVSLADSAWRQVLKAPAQAALAIRIIDRSKGNPLSSVIFIDIGGKQMSEVPSQPTGYDPRTRPWYFTALQQRGMVATGPYQMATTGALGMTISQIHRGNPAVVVGADVVLTTITDFLKEELLTPGSMAFIANERGQPIVHSNPVMMRNILSALENRDADATPDNSGLSAKLASFSGNEDRPMRITLRGRDYLILATKIDNAILFKGNRIFIAAPYDELMAPANRMAAQGLAIAGLVVLLGIGGALLLASMISSSLHRLKSGADQLQEFDFQTPIVVPSSITEISSLSQAMNRARDAIFTFALFVPREIVRKGMESGSFSSRTAARQQVTAIFTDIYDFTTISERYPPEEVVTMLSVYFDVLNQAVSAHKGTIIQFLGDSIFAMWNAPGTDDDHAENACLSALAMQTALAEFNDGQRLNGLPEFQTRVGIHTGVAVVGNVGAADRLQYTAMGDTINVASRLEGMNKTYGTSILASAEVKARCSDRILFRLIGLGQAKGRHIEIELFEVTGVRSL